MRYYINYVEVSSSAFWRRLVITDYALWMLKVNGQVRQGRYVFTIEGGIS